MDLFEECMKIVDKCMKDANMDSDDIHDVVLVGGSSRIPKVQQLLHDFFKGKELCTSIDPDEAVANGSTVQAAILRGGIDKVQDLILLDVTPLSLGIMRESGKFDIFVPRNTTIPTKKSRVATTVGRHQIGLKVHVYEGERIMAEDNNLLGKFVLLGLDPDIPKGKPRITICFDIDANGILTVSAEENVLDIKNKITIANNRGRLSKQEIQRMIKEAEKYNAEDEEYFNNKEETKAALEDYANHIRERLSDLVLNPAKKKRIDLAIEDTLLWLEYNQRAECCDFVYEREKLQNLCNPLVAKAMRHGTTD